MNKERTPASLERARTSRSSTSCSTPTPTGTEHAQPAAKTPDRGETILLVEDDPALRELTRDVLRRNGFTVLTADSDCQALWLWKRHSHQINLLLTDLMIPNRTTGAELARKLRGERPDLPVIFVSGFGIEVGEGETTLLRKSPFLRKPYSSSTLLQTVLDCLASAGQKVETLN